MFSPKPGDVYLIEFPEHDPRGHEQKGIRPALVLSVPSGARFPVLIATPLTTDREHDWSKKAPYLYLKLPKGTAGLPSDSILLLDQTRSIDFARTKRFIGRVEKKILDAVIAHWVKLF